MRKKHNTYITMSAMLFGTFLMAFAYYHINFYNHLTEGGFVGLALLGKYAFDIPPALSMILMDIPVLLIALFIKGRKFIFNTIVATSMFTLFYALIERYSTMVIDLGDHLLIPAIVSGILTGFGAGIVIRYGGAAGGDDVISVLFSEWSGLKVGTVFFLMDAIVLLLSLFYMPLMETLYTILAVTIAGQVITTTVTYGAEKTEQKPLRKTFRASSTPVTPKAAQHTVSGRS